MNIEKTAEAKFEAQLAAQKAAIQAMMDPGEGLSVPVVTHNETLLARKVAETIAASAPDAPKPKETTEEEDESALQDYEPVCDSKGKSSWQASPSFDDQLKRYPDSCRFIGPKFDIFDLTKPEDMNRVNSIMARQQPDHAPGVLIKSTKENFHEGKWLMLLQYFTVEYKKLAPTS